MNQIAHKINQNRIFNFFRFRDIPVHKPLINHFIKTRTLSSSVILVLSFIIFQYLLSQGKFFLPDNPVPVTLQTFGILFMGSLYGFRLATLSISAYLLVGFIGVPIFQGHNGGIDYFFGVTGGYLLGFLLCTAVNSYLSVRGLKGGLSIWAMIFSNSLIYIVAILWLSIFDFSWPQNGQMLSQAVYPFLIGDFIKLIAASSAISFLWKLAQKKEK
jgi:biotin transport system substrate-specific component